MQSYNLDRFILRPLLTVVVMWSVLAFYQHIVLGDLSLYTSFVVLAFILGASFASFFAAMVERLPLGEPTNTPSHCACGRQLKVWENIPILGWLSLRIANKGYTRCCNTKLPGWYFLLESITAFSFAGLAVFFIVNSVTNVFVILSVAVAVLAVVFLVSDYRNIASNNYSD